MSVRRRLRAPLQTGCTDDERVARSFDRRHSGPGDLIYIPPMLADNRTIVEYILGFADYKFYNVVYYLARENVAAKDTPNEFNCETHEYHMHVLNLNNVAFAAFYRMDNPRARDIDNLIYRLKESLHWQVWDSSLGRIHLTTPNVTTAYIALDISN